MSESEHVDQPIVRPTSLVSSQIINGEKVGYAIREDPRNEADTGWRFFATTDRDPLATPLEELPFNFVVLLQPTIWAIREQPVGSVLTWREHAQQWWNVTLDQRVN